MAYAFHEQNNDLGYTCPKCNHLLDFFTVDESEYKRDMWNYIAEHNNSDHFFQLGTYICKTPVSIHCTCEECECYELVTVIAEVEAKLVQEEEAGHSQGVSRFVIDKEVYFVRWLPSSESPDILLSTAIPPDESLITLRIICKTKMKKGFCFMAVNEQRNRLLRPIFNTEPGKCCWPRNDLTERMRVGSLVRFHWYHPSDYAFQISCPHRNEDVLVYQHPTILQANYIKWSPEALRGLSHENIYDIFPADMVHKNKYIYEGNNCPSAGILLAQQIDVKVYQDYNNIYDKIQTRVQISHGEINFDFPLTAKEYYNPQNDGECLVILGLGRPFTSKAKCYILVIGIMALPS